MTTPKIGDMQRTENKEIKLKKEKQKVIKYINLNLNCVNHPETISNELLKQEKAQILKILNEEYNKPLVVFASNFIRKIVKNGVSQNKWDLKIPKRMNLPISKPNFRNADWFLRCKQLSSWLKTWELYQGDLAKKGLVLSQEEILASMVISASMYGGLNYKDALISLVNSITQNKKPLYETEDVYWFELIISNKRFPSNYKHLGKDVYLKRWYPDNITLMWVNNLLNKKKGTYKNYSNKSLWETVNNLINRVTKYGNINLNSVKSLEDLTSAAIGVAERLNGVSLNQTLLGYAKGEIYSASLRPEYQEGLIKNDYTLKSDDEEINLDECEQTKEETRFRSFYLSLKDAVKPQIDDKKGQRKKGIEKIYSIESETQCEFYLHCWVIHHLEERNNTFGSVSGYLGNIGESWLEADEEGIDISDGSQLEEFYKHKFNDETDYVKRRLFDFHQYCSERFGFPSVDTFKGMKKVRSFVKAGFISEQLYEELLKNIMNSSLRFKYKNMFISLFILAYRTGLRISEIRKIRVRDVEFSDDLWIYVRVNQYENNKGPGSYRKFPLGVLLLKKEREYLKGYLERKKVKPNVSLSSLIFSTDLMPKKRISSGFIYNIFRKNLADKYEAEITMHLMRHTALSKLHAIFSNNTYLIKKITCYNKKQIKEIQTKFNCNGKNKFWNLAALAGHQSTQTTFTSYLHFTDFMLYTELSKFNKNIELKELILLTGCSRQYLNRNLQGEEINSNQTQTKAVNFFLKNSLKKHTNSVTSSYRYARKNLLRDVKIEPDPMICLQILELVEKGEEAKDIAKKFEIPVEWVEMWVKNASELANIKTGGKKPSPRLFSRKKKMHLAPGQPSTKFELNIAENILDSSVELMKNNKNILNKVISYLVNNINSSKTILIFSDPHELHMFLTIIQNFFMQKYIILEFQGQVGNGIGKQIKLWKDAILNDENKNMGTYKRNFKNVNQRRKYSVGKITLKITHPMAKEYIGKSLERDIRNEECVKCNKGVRCYKHVEYKEVKSSMLKFVFHLLAIVKLEKFIDEKLI